MNTNDVINAAFEFGMGVMLTLNVRRLLKDKQVQGVSAWPVLWATAWGAWNLYYYYSLAQTASWVAGMFVFATNITWVLLALYYDFTHTVLYSRLHEALATRRRGMED